MRQIASPPPTGSSLPAEASENTETSGQHEAASSHAASDWSVAPRHAGARSGASPPDVGDDAPQSAVPIPAPATVSLPDTRPRPASLRLLQEGRFHLDVQGADLRGVLAGLVRGSPFSLIVGPEVQGEVTADLRGVSLFDILEKLVVPRGYAYDVSGTLLRIGAPALETRTYEIDYPSYDRSGKSELTVYGAIETSVSIGESSGSESADASAASVGTTQQLDLWQELGASLRGIVLRDAAGGDTSDAAASASAGGRQVLVAEQSGLVLVRAEPAIQDEVESFLDAMTRATERQVLIDARILEVTLGDSFDLGIDLEYAPDIGGGTQGVVARLIDPTRRDAVVQTALSAPLTDGGVTFGIAGDRLSAQLRALAAQTDVRVVSTPRVATLNNHKALIKVVRNQVFFIAETDVQLVEGVGTSITTDFVPQIVPIGVTLDVTPRISSDGQITMHIHPSVSEIVAVQSQPSTTPGTQQLGSLPVIDLRETDTVVRVQDGETIVIGGLMRSRELDIEKKVPFLGDLPLVGALFRSTAVDELRTELVVLLTPTVIEPARVRRVAADAIAPADALDTLRRARRPVRQWWRQPYGRSYGAP
jgi:MSHA biogenesis protein MshL